MMARLTWILVLFVLSRAKICKTQSKCSEISAETKFLQNIDRLLNNNRVKVMNGMTLRKKNISMENNEIMCDNTTWVEAVGIRIKRMMETHVVEFDLASIVQKGKLHFHDKLYGIANPRHHSVICITHGANRNPKNS